MMRRRPVLTSTVTAMPGVRVYKPLIDLHGLGLERDARHERQILRLRVFVLGAAVLVF